MKKKILSAILCVAMIATMAVGCTTKSPTSGGDDKKDDGGKKDSYKVGITIQSLKNDYWAGVMGKLEELMKDKGWDYTLQDCSDNSATQIS